MVSMVKQSSKPSNEVLEENIDRRLARIFGKDAEILVIYPLSSKKDYHYHSASSDLEKSPSDGVNEDD